MKKTYCAADDAELYGKWAAQIRRDREVEDRDAALDAATNAARVPLEMFLGRCLSLNELYGLNDRITAFLSKCVP